MSDETTELPSHEDAIKELEADIWRSCEHLTTNGEILVNVPWEKLREWFAIAATLGRKELERENSKLEHKMSNMETKLLKAQERIDELNATLGSERHPYEQRITGDGSDWGEIMCNAYDDLIASACESCTPEQIGQLADHIRAELGSGMCECVVEYAKSPIDGKTIVLHRCSACHELMRPFMHYCPNCGAKVVG